MKVSCPRYANRQQARDDATQVRNGLRASGRAVANQSHWLFLELEVNVIKRIFQDAGGRAVIFRSYQDVGVGLGKLEQPFIDCGFWLAVWRELR